MPEHHRRCSQDGRSRTLDRSQTNASCRELYANHSLNRTGRSPQHERETAGRSSPARWGSDRAPGPGYSRQSEASRDFAELSFARREGMSATGTVERSIRRPAMSEDESGGMCATPPDFSIRFLSRGTKKFARHYTRPARGCSRSLFAPNQRPFDSLLARLYTS